MNRTTVRIVLFFVLIPINFTVVQKLQAANHPEVSAEASVVMDVHSGRFLFAKNADMKKPIASITKIMTAIIAIEHGDLRDKVTISRTAAGIEGSSLYLKAGEQMELRHLLYGLMLRSGNDAAAAIAEHIGGSVAGFAVLMNEKAVYLGMTHTHFENPHGLDMKNHYSSARDMAKLTAYALNNDTFQEIVATKAIIVPAPGERWDRKWYNKNKMLNLYADADGVKTGYTSLAHRTLVSSATRDGQQLVTVTLNAPNDWNDSISLLNYGFRTYPQRMLIDEQKPVDGVDIKNHTQADVIIAPEYTFTYPLTEQELAAVERTVNIPGELPPGLTEGVRVGNIIITFSGREIGKVPLITKKVGDEADASEFWAKWVSLLSPVWKGRTP